MPNSARSTPQTLPGIDLKPAITGSAGDYDRAGADAFLTRQSQDKAVFVRIVPGLQAHHLIWNRHLDSKLLRLVVGARHQGHAGDPRWKA